MGHSGPLASPHPSLFQSLSGRRPCRTLPCPFASLKLGAGTLDNLGDNPGEVEELSSIDFGTGLNVVAPESPGAEFAATPAPTGAVRDADIGEGRRGGTDR